MKQPTKQQLRDEIAQLREDLFTLIEATKDNELLFPILLRNQWYYTEKFNRKVLEDIFKHAYGEEPKDFKGVLHYTQPAN